MSLWLTAFVFLSASVSSKIREQLKEEEINIYQFPECDSDEDEDFKRQDAEMKVQRQSRTGLRSQGRRMCRWKLRKVSVHGAARGWRSLTPPL